MIIMITLNQFILERLKLNKDTKSNTYQQMLDLILVSFGFPKIKDIDCEHNLDDLSEDTQNAIKEIIKLNKNIAVNLDDWIYRNHIKTISDLDGPYKYVEDDNYDNFTKEQQNMNIKYKKPIFIGDFNKTIKNVMNKKDTICLETMPEKFKKSTINHSYIVISKDTIYYYVENAKVILWHLNLS